MPWDYVVPGCFDVSSQFVSANAYSALEMMYIGLSARVELVEERIDAQDQKVDSVREEVCYLEAQNFAPIDSAKERPSYSDLARCFFNKEITSDIGGKQSLKQIFIPWSVEVLREECFSGCESLSSVVFVDNSRVKLIERDAFANCKSLREINVPPKAKICPGAFVGTDVAGICNNNSMYFLQNRKNLKKIEIPENVETLCMDCFKDSASLSSVQFGNNSCLKMIESTAFQYCVKLKEIEIPAGVETMSQGCFDRCENLISVRFANNSCLKLIGEFAFSGCKKLKEIEIPASVETISDGCFYGCENLISVRFVTNSCLRRIERTAFSFCKKLKEIEIPAGVETISDVCFGSCENLISVRFASNSCLKRIERTAFSFCKKLKEIEIPASVETISNGCFYGCESLTSVRLASNSQLKSIDELADAFPECWSLVDLELPAHLKGFDSARLPFPIVIRTLKNTSYTIAVRQQDTIKQIKGAIQTKTGLDPRAQNLILRGQVLENDGTIASYSIKKGETIHLVERIIDKSVR